MGLLFWKKKKSKPVIKRCSVEELIDDLRSGEWGKQFHACNELFQLKEDAALALRKIAPKNSEVIKSLKAASEDLNNKVASYAKFALTGLGRK